MSSSVGHACAIVTGRERTHATRVTLASRLGINWVHCIMTGSGNNGLLDSLSANVRRENFT